ncbi:SHOCT domain-containing protein [Streptosporangium saharense]|uniref:Putative membrane protein n=1 Tax=Streptosporangium saharense TaxID=1706840 RepID=A0A7W7QUW4_9ACTN|nr:SHOCT domain-containing protein [Streptosporangium saharense]MBB4920192.1 putative membrane protein [Streptosporangium saharense]
MLRIVLPLLVIAVIVLVLVRPAPLLRMLRGKQRPALEDDPREILKRRYAAGEIDEDEYFRRMSGLSQDW